MDYLRVPREVSLGEIRDRDASWSPSMFRRVIIPNPNVKRVEEVLDSWCNGTEVGSISYVDKSPFSFIRTKALQEHSTLTLSKGGSIIPIIPKAFAKAIQTHPKRVVHDGDILYARGGSVGEVAFAHACGQAVMSGHILKIFFKEDPFYCFAFMKHPICKLQQASNIKGAIRALNNFNINTLLNCLIPFPNQSGAERVIRYVSALIQAIVEKEKAIRDKSDVIHKFIQAELEENQKNRQFQYLFPSISDLSSLRRFDAVIYCQEYKSKIWLVKNYAHGYETPSKAGFTITPGPSLEIKIIRTRIDSESYRSGYYTLILPTNISVYGTMDMIPYLGTAKSLPLLKKGDIVFGEAGFQKGRSVVILNDWSKCTTNAHGLYARRSDGDIQKAVFFRCVFNWYRTMRLIDIMAVGGSGGHFSPEYFDYIRIPKFPEDKQKEIAWLYHHDSPQPPVKPTLDTFVDWHRQWNAGLGIWELDREMKALQLTLSEVQEQIIEGKTVKVPLNGE